MNQKSYPYQTAGKFAAVIGGIAVIFIIFLLLFVYAEEFCIAMWDVAIQSTVSATRTGSLIMILFTLISIIAAAILVFGGYNIEAIVFTEKGLLLRRRRNPILITRIDGIKEPGPFVLEIDGIGADGEMIKRRIAVGDLGKKRWEEFKRDLYGWQSGQQAVKQGYRQPPPQPPTQAPPTPPPPPRP